MQSKGRGLWFPGIEQVSLKSQICGLWFHSQKPVCGLKFWGTCPQSTGRVITQGSHFSQSLDLTFHQERETVYIQKVQDPLHLFVGVFAEQSLTYAAHGNLHFDNEDSKTQGWRNRSLHSHSW